MTTFLRPAVTAQAGALAPAAVTGGGITLAALAIPYAQGTVELPLSADNLPGDYDPRTDARLIVVGADAIAGTSRTFDLGIRERTLSSDGKQITVTVASDEALMTDYTALVEDTGAVGLQTSLRSIVNYVLGKVIPGKSLEAGGPDADMSAYYNAKNMFLDPRYAGTPGGGYAVGFATLSTDPAFPGSYHGQAVNGARLSSPTSPDSYIQLSNAAIPYGMTAGKSYTFSATGSVRTLCGGTEDTSRSRRLYVAVKNSSGVYVPYYSAVVPNVVESGALNPANEHRVSVTFPIPVGATEVQLRGYLGHTVGAITWTAFRLDEVHAVVNDVEFFSGNTADTTVYGYDWSGTVDGSASTRTALVNRPPEMLVWKPAVSAWDFLSPLTSQAGFRLFCDEHRVWRMIDPGTYAVPGGVRLGAPNLTRGDDTITREDAEVFATGVVVTYTWRDSTGAAKVAYDVAGTPNRVVRIDYERPYPGPGAAAAILARRNGTGRVQAVTALLDWTVTPGQVASITLPHAPEQQGKVDSVAFQLSDAALMDVGTRGLIDIPPGSWFAWTPADQQWLQVADTVTWTSLPA